MRVLGIVPARGGSKSVHRKNLAPLCGKPLIWWTLKEALSATSLAEVIVSTDDEEIATAALWHGAVVVGSSVRRPRVVKRPDHLCQDDSSTLSVLQWHINQEDEKPDAVMLLQPTCPLRRMTDIEGAIGLMHHTGCDSVVSYAPVGANHPARMVRIAGQGRVFPLDTALTWARRQDLPELHIRSGDIYLTRREVLEGGSMVGKDQRAWAIPVERHCNIDERIDLALAGARMEYVNADRR